MTYRIILNLNFKSEFEQSYTHWASMEDSFFEDSFNPEEVVGSFVDLNEGVWNEIHSGAFHHTPILWSTTDIGIDLYEKETRPETTIEAGSITFDGNDRKIIICNGDGDQISVTSLDHLGVCEPGWDKFEEQLERMTLKQFEENVTVVRFPENDTDKQTGK